MLQCSMMEQSAVVMKQNKVLSCCVAVFNDGTQQHLVQLEGTIPVPYKGNLHFLFYSHCQLQVTSSLNFIQYDFLV